MQSAFHTTSKSTSKTPSRIYTTRERVRSYNHDHMVNLDSPAIYVEATHQGDGAEKAESQDAGNLSRRLPICIGARVMLTRNLWNGAGLVNGAQGTVYDIGWGARGGSVPGSASSGDGGFRRYTGPPYYIDEEEEVALRNNKAKLVVRSCG